MRLSNTIVVERNATWPSGSVIEVDPVEAGWATEARYFVRLIEVSSGWAASLRVQISPDGMHWVDEGSELRTDSEHPVSSTGVTLFGHWLRLVGQVEEGDGTAKVIVYCVLKG